MFSLCEDAWMDVFSVSTKANPRQPLSFALRPAPPENGAMSSVEQKVSFLEERISEDCRDKDMYSHHFQQNEEYIEVSAPLQQRTINTLWEVLVYIEVIPSVSSSSPADNPTFGWQNCWIAPWGCARMKFFVTRWHVHAILGCGLEHRPEQKLFTKVYRPCRVIVAARKLPKECFDDWAMPCFPVDRL